MQALLVSNALLWVIVVALAALVLVLVRQIGVLHERIAPVGALALAHGPRVGAAAPVVEAMDLTGRVHAIGGAAADGRATLLFFLSPRCPVCKALLPAVAALARQESDRLRVLLAGDGDRGAYGALAARERIGLPLLLSTSLGVAYQVGRLPWAVLVDAAGVLRAHGLVNTREHLESLLEAEARGVASIQEFLARDRPQEAASR